MLRLCLFCLVNRVERRSRVAGAQQRGRGEKEDRKGAELMSALSLVDCHRVPPVSTATRFQPLAPLYNTTQIKKEKIKAA